MAIDLWPGRFEAMNTVISEVVKEISSQATAQPPNGPVFDSLTMQLRLAATRTEKDPQLEAQILTNVQKLQGQTGLQTVLRNLITSNAWLSAMRQIAEAQLAEAQTPPLAHRLATLANLGTWLQYFLRPQFDFFKDIHQGDEAQSYYAGAPQTYKLSPSTWYPRDFALTTILNQAANDLEVIQRAANQRVAGTSGMQETLKIADQLANFALKLATENKLFSPNALQDSFETYFSGEFSLVTYFQKAYTSAVIPYAPVGLIGIPYTATSEAYDLLAIPHEVGHYVYRHGRKDDKPLERYLREKVTKALEPYIIKTNAQVYFPDWCLRWLEEIFADVYGCLVAGPLIAVNFQDLMFRKPFEDFKNVDDTHPLPLLRPGIYNKVLADVGPRLALVRQDKNTWGQWASQLDKEWEARRQPRFSEGGQEVVRFGKLKLKITEILSSGTGLYVNPAPNDAHFDPTLDVVIRAVLDVLLPNASVLALEKLGPWTVLQQCLAEKLQEKAENLAIDRVMECLSTLRTFSQKEKLSELEQAPPGLLPQEKDQSDTAFWKAWVIHEGFFTTGNRLPEPGKETPDGSPWNPINSWIPVLIARGWATEGPNGAWTPPRAG